MAEAPKPIPSPTLTSQPFWAGCREGRLRLQRCGACRQFLFAPRPACPHCGGADLAWSDVSGRGRVFSFTVVHRAPSEAFRAQVPYVVAIVELEEGVRLLANVVGCAPADVRVGMPVRAVFEPVTADIGGPKFQGDASG